MIIRRRSIKLSMWAVCMAVMLLGHSPAVAQDTGDAPKHRTEVEVQLNESFYRALAADDGKTYRTNRSDEYLRQIAVSAKYMVETNIKVVENQQRIIELLEALQKSATK